MLTLNELTLIQLMSKFDQIKLIKNEPFNDKSLDRQLNKCLGQLNKL